MSDFVHHHECNELIEALAPLAASVKDRPLHWISTPDGTYESNYGSDWCADCGYYMMRHLRKRDRRRSRNYLLDGGWGTEEEHLAHCAGCGVRLQVSLLKYGGLDELAHYRDCGFSKKPEQDAYDIIAVLECFSVTSDDDGAACATEAVELAKRLATANGIEIANSSGVRHDDRD